MPLEYLNKPFEASIYITLHCNVECKHCMFDCSPFSEKYYIPLNDFNKILKKLYENGVVQILLIGGEPVLHPDFQEFVKLVYDYGFAWFLVSNGTLINEKIADLIAKYEPTNVRISLHGPDAETHEFIMGPNTFKKTLKSIKLLRNMDLNVTVLSALHKKLCSKEATVRKHLELLLDLDVKLSPDIIIPQGRALKYWNEIAPPYSDLEKATELIRNEYSYLLEEGPQTVLDVDYDCWAARTCFAIDPYGNCYPCDNFIETKLFFGNILEQDLDDIWKGKLFQQIREIGKKRGICAALSYIHYKDFYHSCSEIFRKYYIR